MLGSNENTAPFLPRRAGLYSSNEKHFKAFEVKISSVASCTVWHGYKILNPHKHTWLWSKIVRRRESTPPNILWDNALYRNFKELLELFVGIKTKAVAWFKQFQLNKRGSASVKYQFWHGNIWRKLSLLPALPDYSPFFFFFLAIDVCWVKVSLFSFNLSPSRAAKG